MNFIIKTEPRTKKNSQRMIKNQRTGKMFPVPSAQFKEYEQTAGWFVPKDLGIDYPVNIKCLFYMATKRKCDLTNLLEAIDDIMVKYNVITDDNYTIVAGHDGSRVYYDKENPRTEVFIERIKPCEQDLLGGTNCSGCIANMACEACGRKGTEFCVECTNEEKDVIE